MALRTATRWALRRASRGGNGAMGAVRAVHLPFCRRTRGPRGRAEHCRASRSDDLQPAKVDASGTQSRRRIRGARCKRLVRRRGELRERPCAHLYESGGLRRAHVRGHENVLKRLLIHASAFNLGLWMKTLFGIGTPRALHGHAVALRAVLSVLWTLINDAIVAIWIHHDWPLPIPRSGFPLDACA